MKPGSMVMGAIFLATVFFLAPAGAIQLNEAWDWPRWQIPMGSAAGIGVILAGLALIFYCSGLFARFGKGTPVPIQPPEHLVIQGLYRYCRNPMYVGQVAILLGLFLYRGELALLLYAALWAGAVERYVVWREEPELRRRFGEAYVHYTQSVPRWIPRRPPDVGS